MAEVRSEMLPFAADALHTNALTASNGAALEEGGADYYGLHQTILEIGRSCLTPGSRVVDLRCDLESLMPLVMEHEDLCKYVALSPTEQENWECFDRLRTRVRLGFVDAACLDLHENFPEISARLILALGALGDLSGARRREVVESMHRRLERNGAAIVMEEVQGEDMPVHREFGSMDRRKRRPWTSAQWESLLLGAGFSTVISIWSNGSSEAWMVKK